jgi:hypothetical protein
MNIHEKKNSFDVCKARYKDRFLNIGTGREEHKIFFLFLTHISFLMSRRLCESFAKLKKFQSEIPEKIHSVNLNYVSSIVSAIESTRK